ncbi:MAG: four helix bundle protein [Polyangiaceae bacterium]
MSSLHVHTVAIETIRLLRPLMPRLSRFDLALAKQITRSASSIALNIAEGQLSQGGTRRQRYLSAAGSANETRSALLVAEAWGYLSGEQSAKALGQLDQIVAMLWKLTHS